jgi:hypothetical protein
LDVRNPFYISDVDWVHLLSMGVVALKEFVHEQDVGFLDGLTEETFWPALTPLIKGRIHSVKDGVLAVVSEMTGNRMDR